MFGGSRKPYSAVTVQIERLTSEQYEPDDLGGIVDLVEVVRIQDSGPTEAARAIRKKLKYGNVHRQLRALTILDGLIQNAGSRFQRAFADEPLLERLRILARDDMVDPDVRAKCNILFRQWAVAYKGTAGLEQIATLYKQLPQTKKRPHPSQSKVLRETEAEAEQEPLPDSSTTSRHRPTLSESSRTASSPPSASRPTLPPAAPLSSSSIFSSMHSKDRKGKIKPFNLEKEKPRIMETIASASVASTNLQNALQLVNRENERVSENREVMERFETCKRLRRQVLRYIQLVESDQWIGSLLTANDELVKALMSYEILDKSVEDDSDSEYEQLPDDNTSPSAARKPSLRPGTEAALAGLNLSEPSPPPKPQRPGKIAMPSPPPMPIPGKQRAEDSESESEEDLDPDDPFGDQNAVKTPYQERSGMTW
ncbi:hypothetical protein W97_08456 [Coniosporium apollinis CBS 100218]|uniref:VHS domain-containing protein n=1 Tax=Coniosporium apollinis (strain CBS 100218) TaxID=1168221 RepID=R7Z5U5_CONA1|nr:uncharacterized protein W97_08456 [Coniosporium apollinis CBS 100218]EON69296.1 hypothetical protein W97_08456 [Coniosporium apollinis CBS 100218]